ncbi:MAG TPA: hypothetical protein VFD92_13170 [Candidatus Binatia bacterium]|nr:hypothetical protein [Candidatus Binatia bacterium]
MKLSTAVVVASLLGMAAPSQARTITSRMLPAGSNNAGACYFRNVGTTPISLQVSALRNFKAGFITPSSESCNGAPLAAGKTCYLLVNLLPDHVGFSCSAEFSGSGRNLRAEAELRDAGDGHVLAAETLR